MRLTAELWYAIVSFLVGIVGTISRYYFKRRAARREQLHEEKIRELQAHFRKHK